MFIVAPARKFSNLIYNSAKITLVMEEKKARKKEAKKHSLPWIRFTTVATIIVAIDSISCVALWIAGGNSKYLEDSVEDFSLVKSTFDLACLAVVRGVILIALLYLLERAVIRDVSLSTTGKTRRRTASNYNIALHIFILVIAFACVCYAAVKGGFVIHEWRRGRYMHVTYKVLCIVATVFPLVELLLGAASFYYMGKLRTQQVMLIVNEMEEQDEGSGVMNAEKKKASFRTANLKRLLLMAKPVSNPICIYAHSVKYNLYSDNILSMQMPGYEFVPIIVMVILPHELEMARSRLQQEY